MLSVDNTIYAETMACACKLHHVKKKFFMYYNLNEIYMCMWIMTYQEKEKGIACVMVFSVAACESKVHYLPKGKKSLYIRVQWSTQSVHV